MARVAGAVDRLARPVAAVLLGLAVIVVSAALGIGLFAERAPARSRPDGIRLLQLNICGHVCNHDRPVTAVVDAVADFRPEAVSLDEVCRGQLAAVVGGLGRRGWAMAARFLVTSPGACGGDDYGIAVLTRSRVVGAGSLTYSHQSPGTLERRGLLCVEAALGGRPSEVCGTHLVSEDGDPGRAVRREQADEARTVVDAFSRPVVLMGDLNLPPEDAGLAAIYRGTGVPGTRALQEVDEVQSACRCGSATHSGGSKLDYVFVSARDFVPREATVARTGFSDHKALRGVVAIR